MEDFYDLKRLFKFREVLASLDPAGPPRAVLVEGNHELSPDRIGLLPGSFNPPTVAHVELAWQALRAFRLDRVIFVISKITVDKERPAGLVLEDRLLLLSLLAGQGERASVAATNRGLYTDQAMAVRQLTGGQARLYFLVGMDKVLQIFDPRYYRDRERALNDFFTEARLIAANRGTLGEKDLAQLLQKSENQPYQDRIHFLHLSQSVQDLASSSIRARLEKGERLTGGLPPVVAEFTRECGAYTPAYEWRALLLERLYAAGARLNQSPDLKKLWLLAQAATEEGRAFRQLLRASPFSAEEFTAFVSNAATSGW